MSLQGGFETAGKYAAVSIITAFVVVVIFTYRYVQPWEQHQPDVITEMASERMLLRLEVNEIMCLAENVYHEARGESLVGQYAVAYVTLNRRDDPRWPDSLCGVVHEAYSHTSGKIVAAFSWTRQDVGRPDTDSNAWEQAFRVAFKAVQAGVPTQWHGVTYYHATSVSEKIQKHFSDRYERFETVGSHVFYTAPADDLIASARK